jgi:hypothetical protein
MQVLHSNLKSLHRQFCTNMNQMKLVEVANYICQKNHISHNNKERYLFFGQNTKS